MSMRFFRDKRNSTFTIVVFGLIIVSFIFWGAFEWSGPSSTSLTRVNGQDVSYSEFQRVLARQLEAYGQMFGKGQKMNKSLEDFVRRQVASSLISRKIMAQEAKSLGIIVGKEDVVAELEKIEAFQDPQLKRFSPRIYELVLQQNGLRPREFEESLIEELSAKRYQQLIEHSIVNSSAELAKVHELQNTRFDLRTAKFDLQANQIQRQLATTEAELEEYFKQNQSQFLTSEKRVLQVARLDLDDLKLPAVSDEEVESFYQNQIESSSDAKWSTPRARAYHLLISDTSAEGLKKTRQILADMRGEKLDESSGEFENFFKTQVRLQSEDYATSFRGGDLGYFSSSDMVKSFSDAVFKAKERTLIGPIKSDFGYHLIYVVDKSSGDKTLKNHRAEIEYEIQSVAQQKLLEELRTQIQANYVTSKSNDTKWLESKGFVITETSPIDRSAREALIPFSVTQRAFESEPQVWQEPEEFEDSLILVRTQQIIAPEPMEFEQAKDLVSARLKEQKLQNMVQEVHAKLKSNEMKWAELASLGAQLNRESNLKAFELNKVPNFPQFDPLTWEFQALGPDRPLSQPILVEGTWALLMAENFKTPSPNDAELASLRQERLTAKSTDILDATLEKLMKEAKIPEDFRKEFGI